MNVMDIKQELVVFLRNQDIISITDRGVTTEQDTGTFTSDLTYTLSVTPLLIKNVRNVNIGGNNLIFGVDYLVNYGTGVITFTVAKSGSYTINYDTGSSDSIYPDFPQPYLKLSDFPRIAVDILSGTTKEIALNATTTQTDYLVSSICYSKSQTEVENMINKIRTSILANKKNLFYTPFITLTNTGPILVSEFSENKIVQRNQDASVQYIFEVNP